MKSTRKRNIVLTVLAAFAAAVLFVTYGTVLPSAPFAAIHLDGPTAVDSDGTMTVVVDSGSNRALIMNADDDLTGVVSCTAADTPIDAITDVCVVDGDVFMSGVRFAPDSDVIKQERVVAYDKGGNFQEVLFELDGTGETIPAIKSMSNVSGGVAIAYESRAKQSAGEADAAKASSKSEESDGTGRENREIVFTRVEEDNVYELKRLSANEAAVHDAAFSGDDANRYATLSVRGVLDDGVSEYGSQVYAGHVFTAIDFGDEGTLYACDDQTGGLCVISSESAEARVLVKGEGFSGVHANGGVISLCDNRANSVMLCDESGAVMSAFSEVAPSVGFSARMLLVWASGLYLAALVIALVVRKLRNFVREGNTKELGPIILSVAVVSAVAIAVGSLSLSSYQTSLEQRAREINMCADYLQLQAMNMGEAMERVNNRDALRGEGDTFGETVENLVDAASPALLLTDAANDNNIGMYTTLYGKDDKGIFYLYGSSSEHVMGTSAHESGVDGLEEAFQTDYAQNGKLLQGRALRDTVQYRLVQVPTADGKGIAGVIEVGSRTRSFESSLTSALAQRVLALLVLVLVVYLAYSELRACGRCLLSYHQRCQEDAVGSVAVLTRPFTLAITMLTSIDSVMTVLIARDLLSQAGVDASGALLAIPAVMLGVGLIIGQGLYGLAGSRVGLRRLVTTGALVMLLCACLTGVAAMSGEFWFYCVAKLIMSIPFGLLYTLGYSLPRLAGDEETRALAAGGVKRTDTSAAALGTVLGGYAAQTLGNGWVYVIVAMASLVIVVMALNLLPKAMRPLEVLAQPDHLDGHILDFIRTPVALALAFLVVLPATVAAGYASFLFPLFSADLGLAKSDINNIVVLGQLVVYVSIGQIERTEGTYGRWKTTMIAIALMGAVFLLFSVNTTLAWSLAVIALVALLGKTSDGWKAMWQKAAGEVGVPTGRATGAMFATRSLALIVQPSILGALVGAADSVAVIVIGLLCVGCAGLFFLTTRKTSLAGNGARANDAAPQHQG